jgi:hypothetical protein
VEDKVLGGYVPLNGSFDGESFGIFWSLRSEPLVHLDPCSMQLYKLIGFKGSFFGAEEDTWN